MPSLKDAPRPNQLSANDISVTEWLARNRRIRLERDLDRRRKLGDFFKAKRAALDPLTFGLPVHLRRRVAGLRREEVALLAGISVTWYTQIESAASITISPALLGRLADVFRLTQLERAYIFTLGIDEMGIINRIAPQLEVLSGSRIAAPTFAGEIAQVLRAHRTIKTHMYATIVHETFDELEPHLDETRCPIGIWLHDDLALEHRHEPHYSSAARAHAAFHREIERVVRVGTAGRSHDVEGMLVGSSAYVVASSILERTFAAWPSGAAA